MSATTVNGQFGINLWVPESQFPLHIDVNPEDDVTSMTWTPLHRMIPEISALMLQLDVEWRTPIHDQRSSGLLSRLDPLNRGSRTGGNIEKIKANTKYQVMEYHVKFPGWRWFFESIEKDIRFEGPIMYASLHFNEKL